MQVVKKKKVIENKFRHYHITFVKENQGKLFFERNTWKQLETGIQVSSSG